MVARRSLMRALPVLALAGVARPAQAADVPELALACDTTLGPALRAVAALYRRRTGVRVNVFPTPPGLILPQLLRQVQNDILVSQDATLSAAVRAGVVAPDARRGGWQDPLVLAARVDAPNTGPVAVSDPTPGSDMDGPAILAGLGLPPAPVQGVIDTDTVAALLLAGTARAGLLHLTDVRAHPQLRIVRTVPASVQPPIAYAAAVTRLARRPDPAGFVAFLVSAEAAGLLQSHGLEAPA